MTTSDLKKLQDNHDLFISELNRRWPLEYRWMREWDTCATVKDFMEWLKSYLESKAPSATNN